MWTGRQAFERIEKAIMNLHRQETELDSALASATAEAERLRKERNAAFRELARVKLDEIAANRLVENLDAGERRASQLLESRRHRLEELAEQKQKLLAALEKAEADRSTAAAELENAINRLDELRARVADEIKANPEWRQAREALEAAESVAGAAEAKAAQSEAELTDKRKPYDEDPLFAYLWRIGYATPRYQAGSFARFMDRMAANYIGYHEARLNYAMLIEIPERLKEHAKLQREMVDERRRNLQEIERRALVEAGEEALSRAVEEARKKFAAADEEVDAWQSELRALDEKRGALVAGADDPIYQEALKTIAIADAQDQFATLVEEARRTATPADDAIVRRIGELNDKIEQIDREIAELRGSARTIAERRIEMERTRDRFRKSGYDHPDAIFQNDVDLERILKQVLGGVVTSGVLWDVLRGGFGVRVPRGRQSRDLSFPFPFPVPMPGQRQDTRGGDWRRAETGGGWSPGDDAWSWKRYQRDDDDDDDIPTGGGEWKTGGRF